MISSLYNDSYDDREEDSSIGGVDWISGEKARHRSLEVFRKELLGYDIALSTAKIRKILITGGLWSTVRSREIQKLYERYHSISRVAEELNVTTALVTIYLPDEITVYDLDEKSLATLNESSSGGGRRKRSRLRCNWFFIFVFLFLL